MVLRGTVHRFDDLGFGTNGDAEWLALIRALEVAQRLGLTCVELIGDAADVVRKANAALAEGEVQGHAADFRALAGKGPPARIRWIRRAQNLAGIALAARHPR